MGIASCQIQHSGSGRYLTGSIQYYADDRTGELPGCWYGGSKLGLEDCSIKYLDKRVDKLLQGLNPTTGEALRKGGNTTRIYIDDTSVEKRGRECKSTSSFDLTLSAPKSMSVLWAASSADKQLAIETAQSRAVQETLSYVEQNFCFIRSKGEREKASLTAATFQHSTSREEEDPQLHHHCLLMNVGVTESGKSGALDSKKILHNIHEIGKVYENSLRRELHEIGLTTVEKKLRKGSSFEIEGVPNEVCKHFSKRRSQIEQLITPESTSKEIQQAVLQTRTKKEGRVDREDLFAKSRAVAHKFGFDPEKEVWSKAKNKAYDKEGKEEGFKKLSEDLTRSLQSIEPFRAIKDRDIKAQVLKASQGKFSLKEVESFTHKYVKENLHQIGGELDRWKRDDTKRESKLHLRVRTDEGIVLRQIKDKARQAFSPAYQDRVSALYAKQDELKEQREAKEKATGVDTPKLYTLKDKTKRDSLYSIVRDKLAKPLKDILPEGKALSKAYHQKQFAKKQKRYEKRRNQFTRKIFFLYMRGKITRSAYQKLRDGKGTPKSKLQANLKYATHQISKKQRDFVVRVLEKKEAAKERKQAEMKQEELLERKQAQPPKITIKRESDRDQAKITIERERDRER